MSHLMFNMAAVRDTIVKLLLYSAGLTLFLAEGESQKWPVPYERVAQRPPSNPYCQAGASPFCPAGRASNTMPTLGPKDTVIVYAMKTPASQSTFGKLVERYHIMDDAIGFHHVQSGANFTMEWYEMFGIFNATFPHVLEDESLVWCNQGAACISDGIDEDRWKVKGSLVQVATISGEIFNKFANWTEYDNNTVLFYETWTVRNKAGGHEWFKSWDRASWVLRAFDELQVLGANFSHRQHFNYTRLTLDCRKEPQLLGKASDILPHWILYKKVVDFYERFQNVQSMPDLILVVLEYAVVEGEFFLYYNQQYWRLYVEAPFVDFINDSIPLPGEL